MLCLPYYAYVFSSTKLEIRAEQVLPGSERGGARGWERGEARGWERGTRGRNDTMLCTCE
jgi:hypothetical protein